jgi:hypothetical protein
VNKFKKYPVLLSLCLGVPVLILTPLAKADDSDWVRNHHLIHFYDNIRAGACSVSDPAVGLASSLTPLDSLVYNRNAEGLPDEPVTCNLLYKPDQVTPLTLSEFKAIRARAWLSCKKCSTPGTRSVLHFTGLVPNGTYTVWLFVKSGSLPPDDFSAVGALGTTMPIENFFKANERGEGRLDVTTPAENLSASMTPVDSCFLDTPFELHVVYHSDNMTHGNGPGPTYTWVTVGLLLFP